MKARYLLLALLAVTLLPLTWARGAWAGGGTPVTESSLASGYLSYRGSVNTATATKFTTGIPGTASGDGVYESVFHRNITGSVNDAVTILTWRIASGAVSGTPRSIDIGTGNPGQYTVSVEGGFVCITVAGASTADFTVSSLGQNANAGTYLRNWTVTDAAASGGTAATRGLGTSVQALTGSSLALSGAISGATTGAFSSTLTIDDDLVCTTTAKGIRSNTSDSSDSKAVYQMGGGAWGAARGGGIGVYGNEHSTNPGCLDMGCGDVAGALWRVYTGASVLRLSIDRNGIQTSACGQVNAWTTKTGNYTMQATDYGVVVDATSSSLNITLPANSAGRTVHIKRVDSSGNTVTLIPPSGNIRGAANITLSASFAAGYEAILIGNGGSQWY